MKVPVSSASLEVVFVGERPHQTQPFPDVLHIALRTMLGCKLRGHRVKLFTEFEECAASAADSAVTLAFR